MAEEVFEGEVTIVTTLGPTLETEEADTRTEYQRANEAALIERKAILERNGLKFEDHTSTDGVEIVKRCCG